MDEEIPLFGLMDVGSHKGKDDKAPLSEIIDVGNERFGTNFTTPTCSSSTR